MRTSHLNILENQGQETQPNSASLLWRMGTIIKVPAFYNNVYFIKSLHEYSFTAEEDGRKLYRYKHLVDNLHEYNLTVKEDGGKY